MLLLLALKNYLRNISIYFIKCFHFFHDNFQADKNVYALEYMNMFYVCLSVSMCLSYF